MLHTWYIPCNRPGMYILYTCHMIYNVMGCERTRKRGAAAHHHEKAAHHEKRGRPLSLRGSIFTPEQICSCHEVLRRWTVKSSEKDLHKISHCASPLVGGRFSLPCRSLCLWSLIPSFFQEPALVPSYGRLVNKKNSHCEPGSRHRWIEPYGI